MARFPRSTRSVLILCALAGGLLAACGSDPAGPGSSGGVNSSANWRWLNPLPAGNWINRIAFRTDREGLAVGEDGLILSTTDGGTHWSVAYVGNAPLRDIAYAPDGSRYIAGRGVLLHSTNNKTWTPVPSPPPELWSIAVGEGYLVALGANTVFVSNDGGLSYDDPSGSLSTLSDVAVRGSLCLVVTRGGEILRSRDRGVTWDPPHVTPNASLLAVQIVSDTRAFACGGNSLLLKTDNAGDTWEPVNTAVDMDIQSVAFVTPLVGYLGGGEMGVQKVIRTGDGGQSWLEVSTPGSEGSVYDISASSQSTIHAHAGDDLFRSDNGGGSWTPTTHTVTRRTLKDVSLLESNTIIAVQSSGIIRSNDRGRTWSELPAGTSYSLNGVRFHDSQVGAAVGHPGQVWFTSNGGASWDERGPGDPTTLYKAHFFSPNELMVVGAGTDDIFYTDNAGASWSKRPSPNTGNLIGMSVRDDQRIVVCGHNRNVSVTVNRGVTWIAANLSAASVSVLEDCAWRGDVVIAVGRGAAPVVVRSQDNGATWSVSSLGTATFTASAVAFRNDQEVFVSTNDGKVFRSQDAGVTWNEETLPVRTPGGIEAIAFFNDGTGIFVGVAGTVLAR